MTQRYSFSYVAVTGASSRSWSRWFLSAHPQLMSYRDHLLWVFSRSIRLLARGRLSWKSGSLHFHGPSGWGDRGPILRTTSFILRRFLLCEMLYTPFKYLLASIHGTWSKIGPTLLKSITCMRPRVRNQRGQLSRLAPALLPPNME
jgi:hypothetical protein